MPRNETSAIVAANSSDPVLVNATGQMMSLVNESLQTYDIEDMDEETCLEGEEGCVEASKLVCPDRNAKACSKCKRACIAWLVLYPLCILIVCIQKKHGPCCMAKPIPGTGGPPSSYGILDE